MCMCWDEKLQKLEDKNYFTRAASNVLVPQQGLNYVWES